MAEDSKTRPPSDGRDTAEVLSPQQAAEDRRGDEQRMPFRSGANFPFTYDHSADIPQAHYAAARRNVALQSGEVTPIPPLPVTPDPVAGTSPSIVTTSNVLEGTVALEARGQGSAGGRAAPSLKIEGADPDLRVVRGDVAAPRIVTIEQNLRANLAESRDVAQVLLDATRTTIAELRDARRNDEAAAELIDFLEWLANGLADLVENLDRAIAEPASEPMFLGTAGIIADSLHRGLLEFVEQKRVQIIQYSALTGVSWFLSAVTGTDFVQLLKLFLGK
jgi:hypothetical protein